MFHPARILSTLVLLLVVALPSSARAQVASAPKVNIVLHSIDRLIADLKILNDLTTTTEQKQWKNIKDILDTFLFGIDTKQPVGVELILDAADDNYRFALPVSNLKTFIDDNLGGFDITARKIGPNLYSLRENRKAFYHMRFQKGYATLSQKRGDVNVVFNPRLKRGPLVAKQLSVSATIKNKADGQAARRKRFAPVRQNLLAALKPRKTETAEDFALRRELLVLELGEAERFLAESEALAIGFRIDPKTKKATLGIDLAAIAESNLDKSIRDLSKTPSHFAAVPRAKAPILSFRINHPLDNFRRTSLQVVLSATHKAIQADIDRTATATDAQKTASTKVLDAIVGITESTLKKGVLDAFIEVRPVEAGANVMVAGIRTVNGQQLKAALANAPHSILANNVKLDTDKAGDVAIHQLTVPAKFSNEFAVIFGDSKTILIGTSSDAAWCAAGPGALAELKAAITAQKQPAKAAANPIFVDLAIKVGPWIKALRTRTLTKDEMADLKLAEAAFDGGGDTVELRLQRDGLRVIGSTSLGTGILRFLGKKMSQFSKENFE